LVSGVKHALQNTLNNHYPWLSDSFRMHQIRFGLSPLGELTALPRLPVWFKRVLGLLLRGKGGKRRERNKRKGIRGKERGGKGREHKKGRIGGGRRGVDKEGEVEGPPRNIFGKEMADVVTVLLSHWRQLRHVRSPIRDAHRLLWKY